MHKNALFFIEKLQKSPCAKALPSGLLPFYPDPQPPKAGGFVPKPRHNSPIENS